MFRWFSKRSFSFWALAILVVGKLYEFFVAPIVSLNIENWAISKGIDNELVDGGQETAPMIVSVVNLIVELVDAGLRFAASDWFFGFVCGAILIALWNPALRLPERLRRRRLLHPTLAPKNGLHPAILKLEPDVYEGLKRTQNYGVERWFFHKVGSRFILNLFFERPTAIQQVEITDADGGPIFCRRLMIDNRIVALEFSERLIYEGVTIKCYDAGGSENLGQLEDVKPKLPTNSATSNFP